MTKPNLFHYATSELSNDAAICWLLAWGKEPNSLFFELANDLVNHFLDRTKNPIKIKDIRVKRQVQSIDILVEVNNEYLIAIEDKLGSSHHSDQLRRYKNWLAEEYPKHTHAFIYLTIEDESYYGDIRNFGYKIVTRSNLLKLMEKYKGLDNAIFQDYYQHLEAIENDTLSYEDEENVTKWSYRAWTGFYQALQKKIKVIEESHWRYVANPRGGILAFWWKNYDFEYGENKIPYSVYLQMDAVPGVEPRIVYKVKVMDKEYQSEIRNHVWHIFKQAITTNDDKKQFLPSKTNFRKGTWMTIAEVTGMKTKVEVLEAKKRAEYFQKLLSASLENQ